MQPRQAILQLLIYHILQLFMGKSRLFQLSMHAVLCLSSFCGTHKEVRMEIREAVGLWELCSKFLSLFYSEFLPKFHQYAYFYSFYASDFIIIPQLQLINKLHLIYNNQQNSITYAKKNCTQLFINLTVNNCIIILTILS